MSERSIRDLVEELKAAGSAKPTGQLAAGDFAGAQGLLALPRYRLSPTRQEDLLTDVVRLVQDLPQWREREAVEAILRLARVDVRITDRLSDIARKYKARDRKSVRDWAEPHLYELAHRLSLDGYFIVEDAHPLLDFGYKTDEVYVSADVDGEGHYTESRRYVATATRPGQRFFMVASVITRSQLVGKPTVSSETEQQAHLVGDPFVMDTALTAGPDLHIVHLGRAPRVGDQIDLTYRYRLLRDADTDPNQCAAWNVVRPLQYLEFNIRAPLGIAPRYRFIYTNPQIALPLDSQSNGLSAWTTVQSCGRWRIQWWVDVTS